MSDRRLILMRHCKSSWASPGLADHDRPLNKRGRESAAALGDWLRQEGYLADAALVSSSRRTRDTFTGLGLECPMETSAKLYHATDETTLRLIEGVDDAVSTLLVIGHNPGFAEVAWRLARRPFDHARFGDYPTGATTVFRFAATGWSDIAWGKGDAEDFVIPRALLDPDA